jgi:hypothetical protein
MTIEELKALLLSVIDFLRSNFLARKNLQLKRFGSDVFHFTVPYQLQSLYWIVTDK